jgi:hypothetical protein
MSALLLKPVISRGSEPEYSATIVQSSLDFRIGLKVTLVFAIRNYKATAAKEKPRYVQNGCAAQRAVLAHLESVKPLNNEIACLMRPYPVTQALKMPVVHADAFRDDRPTQSLARF